MAFDKVDTKSAPEALDVLFDQAAPCLPVVTSADIQRICRESLKYDIKTGDRHATASADGLRPLISWNLERIPERLPAGQRIIGYQVDVQPELQFAVLAIVIGDPQGHPGYMLGIRFWKTPADLFVQGYEGFRTSLPSANLEDARDAELEARGESVEDARSRIRELVPQGMSILSEEVVCDGRPQVLSGDGDSLDLAFQNALSSARADAEVIERKTLREPRTTTRCVATYEEAAASQHIQKEIGANGRVTNVHIKTRGRSGILGIGKKPNVYEVEILEPASVEVRVKPPAVVRATAGWPRMRKASALAPKFMAAMEALVPQQAMAARDQYTKMEMAEAFLFALVQQDIGWRSYSIYGIARHHRPVSGVRWSRSPEAVEVRYHSDHADGSQSDKAFRIVRLSEDAFAFEGEYGTNSMEDVCMGIAGCGGTLGGSKPLRSFLQECHIRDVMEEALRRGLVEG